MGLYHGTWWFHDWIRGIQYMWYHASFWAHALRAWKFLLCLLEQPLMGPEALHKKYDYSRLPCYKEAHTVRRGYEWWRMKVGRERQRQRSARHMYKKRSCLENGSISPRHPSWCHVVQTWTIYLVPSHISNPQMLGKTTWSF